MDLKDILISGSAKAARALKGPALQLISKAGQKVGEIVKCKENSQMSFPPQINRILSTKHKNKSNSRGNLPQIKRILSKNVSNLIG